MVEILDVLDDSCSRHSLTSVVLASYHRRNSLQCWCVEPVWVEARQQAQSQQCNARCQHYCRLRLHLGRIQKIAWLVEGYPSDYSEIVSYGEGYVEEHQKARNIQQTTLCLYRREDDEKLAPEHTKGRHT